MAVAALDTAGVAVPYHFRCPISLELMRDPVTVSTGQTYDRTSIEAWVAAGNSTCPVTRSPLDHPTAPALIPNHTLRRLIQDWCTAHRHLGFDRIPTPKQPPDPSLLLSLLCSCSPSSSLPRAARLTSLRRLRSFARDSDKARSILADHGAHSMLLSVIFHGPSSELETAAISDADEEELAVLESLGLISLLLPLPEPGPISEPNGIGRLVALLAHPSPDARVNAAALLDSAIAAARPPDCLRLLAGETEGIFDGLVSLLDCPRAVRSAVRAMFSLCLARANRPRAARAGAGEALLARLGEMERCEAERALATVELLCRGGGELGEGGVAALVRSMTKVSERATEYAAGALAAVCTASEEARRAAVGAGLVAQLLLVVQSGCTDRAKRKAQLLLKLLPTSWPHFSLSVSDDFGPSHVGTPPF